MDQIASECNLEEINEEVDRSETIDDQNNSTLSVKKFIKYPWLNQHFNIRGEKAVCKHCKTMFKNRSGTRLVGHINKCRAQESEDGLKVILYAGANREIINSMVMCFIESNIPLNTVDKMSFKTWMNKLGTHWKAPTRRDLSNLFIPRLSLKLHNEFKAATLKMTAPALSIEFDHWQDDNGWSLLGVIATTPSGKRHLLDIRDTSSKGHHSSAIVEDLLDVLKEIPSQSINSLVSDSAAACKKARVDLRKLGNYSHIIQHRCMAHLVNRIGHRITTKNAQIIEALATATKITGFISSSPYWQSALKSLNHKKIKPACPTRWYSIVTMIEGLFDAKDVILETIMPKVHEEKARVIRSLDWIKLEAIQEVLKPVNKIIGLVEAKDVSLGQAFGSLLNYMKELFAPGYCSEFKESARAALLWQFSQRGMDKDELGLYIAAYVMDRRNKMKYITQDGLYLALETMALIVRSSTPLQRIKSSLIDEFESYRNFREDYALEDKENNPIKWWSNRPVSILMQVAIRLAHLKASSTNIERSFSSLRHIQGGKRMNMSRSLLVDIGRLKLGTNEIYDCDEDEFDLKSYDLNGKQSSPSKCPCIELVEIQQDDLDTSEITDSQEVTDWLETQDLVIVASYKRFSKYVRFSVIFEELGVDGSQSEQVSEDQIRDLVQQSRNSQNYGVFVDSASQAARMDEEIVYLLDP